ncbi:predicted protein [Arabidopsis lyrata subsp. lyrata]|uniref:Predicted protein n=1 Tax=Arabidopsis lyrata subsp. lyrata TaxID=81972 RepID=D7LB33_ARALL|nr:predicted protein [Arabidopsis lyrata subsp. lyrata]
MSGFDRRFSKRLFLISQWFFSGRIYVYQLNLMAIGSFLMFFGSISELLGILCSGSMRRGFDRRFSKWLSLVSQWCFSGRIYVYGLNLMIVGSILMAFGSISELLVVFYSGSMRRVSFNCLVLWEEAKVSVNFCFGLKLYRMGSVLERNMESYRCGLVLCRGDLQLPFSMEAARISISETEREVPWNPTMSRQDLVVFCLDFGLLRLLLVSVYGLESQFKVGLSISHFVLVAFMGDLQCLFITKEEGFSILEFRRIDLSFYLSIGSQSWSFEVLISIWEKDFTSLASCTGIFLVPKTRFGKCLFGNWFWRRRIVVDTLFDRQNDLSFSFFQNMETKDQIFSFSYNEWAISLENNSSLMREYLTNDFGIWESSWVWFSWAYNLVLYVVVKQKQVCNALCKEACTDLVSEAETEPMFALAGQEKVSDTMWASTLEIMMFLFTYYRIYFNLESWFLMWKQKRRISRVNCDWSFIRNNQKNEDHNPNYGTVKDFTGGRNPPIHKVDK